ncbi:MAG: DUF6236 family protein [Candidatus Caenarcaniphilales bacterium]|nr:DUF6236 family protein [Candidatus Caenarcaniphilales bacterium]
MNSILYYPYINLPPTDWTLRTLLYYESVGSIVPYQYFQEPEKNYEPFMLKLVRNELVVPIDPMRTLENPWRVIKPFIEFIKSKPFTKLFPLSDKPAFVRIHYQKFELEIFLELEQLGLAKREKQNYQWFLVEKTAAAYLMKYLTLILSKKLKMTPTTDQYKKTTLVRNNLSQRTKRDTILEKLIPFPQEIDFDKVLNFKEKHKKDLKIFKNKIEQIVLDDSINVNSELFNSKIEEMSLRRDELAEKMKESKFKQIIFGTVFGIAGAATGLAAAQTIGAIIGALPGFANAVYSGLQIEKAEKAFDQSGMKYLALIDKRLR